MLARLPILRRCTRASAAEQSYVSAMRNQQSTASITLFDLNNSICGDTFVCATSRSSWMLDTLALLIVSLILEGLWLGLEVKWVANESIVHLICNKNRHHQWSWIWKVFYLSRQLCAECSVVSSRLQSLISSVICLHKLLLGSLNNEPYKLTCISLWENVLIFYVLRAVTFKQW